MRSIFIGRALSLLTNQILTRMDGTFSGSGWNEWCAVVDFDSILFRRGWRLYSGGGVQAENALESEKLRVANYLNPSTEAKLLRVCDDEMLEKR